ncbi:EAL domain-containing protein [Aquincola sp. S2]|uniref:EAL domain-containing protein n=1 Tax=Pseudaquabacterium terrae TaxID=2732868 RepID=A0ABX2EP04_9BURK|nr:EAL domain-containing protein [Aquabacterium terrae]NRF70297.1 EAL domain-containing protein [Aquabacterium terrae]
MELERARPNGGPLVMPAIVLTIGAALSLALGLAARQEIVGGAQQRFDAQALELTLKIEDRFDAYSGALTGLRALFASSETVTRQQFRQYVAGLARSAEYAGFQVLNYAPHVPAADKAGFEARLRAEPGAGAQFARDFAISPAGERADYYPLTFIEPLEGNERALGRDLGAFPETLKALLESRDSGALASSGRIIAVQDRAGDVGLAMRLPVYRSGWPLDSVPARRAAYLGSVGAGFRVSELMRDMVFVQAASGWNVRVLDGGPLAGPPRGHGEIQRVEHPLAADAQLLFDSTPAEARTLGALPATARAGADDRFQRTLSFALGGRAWAVEVSAPAGALISTTAQALPWLLGIGGLAISVLLAGIVYSLTTSRRRAETIARDMTRHLRASEQQLEEAQHLAGLGSWVLDTTSGLLRCSDEARRILGFGDDLSSPGLAALLARVPAEERGSVDQRIAHAALYGGRVEFEHRLLLPDGSERWVQSIVEATEQGGPAVLRGTVRDDTQRSKAALRLRLEHEVAQRLIGDEEPVKVITAVLEAACRRLGWDGGAAWSAGEDGLARCGASWHLRGDTTVERFIALGSQRGYTRSEGVLGRAWTSAEPVSFDPREAEADLGQLADRAGLTAGLIVPMCSADSLTALEFFSRSARPVDAETIESLRAIAAQVDQYAQRKRAESRLRFVAGHDALTGLANRSTLQRDLVRAIFRSQRHRKSFAVMFIDLDCFKRINDTLGHGVGDALIKACGERLSRVLRGEDSAARFGGDEFVLIIEDLALPGDAAIVAEKVLACCAEPFVIDGAELHVTGSIGVSVYPEDGIDGEALLKNADTAMYRAKDKGGACYQFYTAAMNAHGNERLRLEADLRRALERGELQMHYQPKMNLRTQAIVGVEALMRWRHPVLGQVSPAQFIPIAEDTGLIVAMGRFALEAACADAQEWRRRGLPPVQMSVNLSPRQLTGATLVSDIAGVLQRSGLDPTLLELEITEGAMMKSPETAAALLHELRALGVGLAIDDFGTGYSSLSYLKRFPLSTVKIDRSFVRDLSTDPDARALANGIITLAHGLRMKVVAEGVETAEQLEHLRSQDCDEIQGYWLCKPMPAEQAYEFMAERRVPLPWQAEVNAVRHQTARGLVVH